MSTSSRLSWLNQTRKLAQFKKMYPTEILYCFFVDGNGSQGPQHGGFLFGGTLKSMTMFKRALGETVLDGLGLTFCSHCLG